MISIAVYDVQETVGQGLCDFTTNFPQEYRRELEEISAYFGEPETSEQAMVPALRYSPLREKYLFSLTTRVMRGRLCNRVVHYLVDRGEANAMLCRDLTSLYAVLTRYADQAAQEQLFQLQDWVYEVCKCARGEEPPEHIQTLLVTGAALSDYSQKVRLVCTDVKTQPLRYLDWLKWQMPDELFLQIRFNTNAVCPSEAKGLSIVFCSEDGNRLMERMNNSGGDRADVIVSGMGAMPEYSVMKQEIRMSRDLLAKPAVRRDCAGRMLQEQEGWPEFVQLTEIPFEDPVEAIRAMIERYGEVRAAEMLKLSPYSERDLRDLHSTPPDWLAPCLPVCEAIHEICAPDTTFHSYAPNQEDLWEDAEEAECPRRNRKRKLRRRVYRDTTWHPDGQPGWGVIFFRRLLTVVGLAALVVLLIAILKLIGGSLTCVSEAENIVITPAAVGQTLRMLLVAALGGVFGAVLTTVVRGLKDWRNK